MTPAERKRAQRRVAQQLKKGESPLGGKYREIVQKQIARGQLFKSLDDAIEYAKTLGKPSFIVARGIPKSNMQGKYGGKARWLSLGGMTDPNFHEWSTRGYLQNQKEYFGKVTSYRVMAEVGKPA